MQYEVIKLREMFPVLAIQSLDMLRQQRQAYSLEAGLSGTRASFSEPTLTAYCPDNAMELGTDHTRPTVLICPGGSYQFVAFREAEPVALAFMARGYNAFVLNYSVAPQHYPAALLQLAASVALLRQCTKRFHVNPNALFVAGFSAGGHLAGCLGTMWQQSWIAEQLGVRVKDISPTALILSYPVISLTQFSHRHSCNNLLGNAADISQKSKLSLEQHVSKKTPPTFLWHTIADPVVPVENSLLFANALQANRIPFELHLYPQGGHGLSLCTAETSKGDPAHVNPHCATWFSLCNQWLRLMFPTLYMGA